MIAGSGTGTRDCNLTETTSTATPVYIPGVDKEEDVEEEIIPEKATIFKANNRNIVRRNKFSSKQQFRNHRTRNR